MIRRPGAAWTAVFGINNRGQTAGVGPTAEDLASLPGAGAAMAPDAPTGD